METRNYLEDIHQLRKDAARTLTLRDWRKAGKITYNIKIKVGGEEAYQERQGYLLRHGDIYLVLSRSLDIYGRTLQIWDIHEYYTGLLVAGGFKLLRLAIAMVRNVVSDETWINLIRKSVRQLEDRYELANICPESYIYDTMEV